MKKLPIGIQDFRSLREGGFLYVDKTEIIHRLIKAGKYYFLSRPRRFGKSLLISTIKSLYEGEKELFHNLWIDEKWDWQKKQPVIHLSFSLLDYQGVGLEQAIILGLNDMAKQHHIHLKSTTAKQGFQDLIRQLFHLYGKVVVLIDEYDKPLIDYLDDLKQAKANQKVLKNFYSILKDSDPFIELLLITGVSKFSQVSIFSDLNNLDDLTIHDFYSTIAGYTQEELVHNFQEHLEWLSKRQNMSMDDLLAKIRYWYNGYSWDASQFVYNPFSILKLFGHGIFRNFWFVTGTPTFLVNAIRNQGITVKKLEKLKVNFAFFEIFTLENLDILSLLFQTGYLTIKKIEEVRGRLNYTLAYPNNEVEESFIHSLLEAHTFQRSSTISLALSKMEDALFDKKIAFFIDNLKILFSDIAYQLFKKGKKDPTKADEVENFKAWEGYFQTVIYLVLSFIGMHIECEISKNKGRIDAIVHTDYYIYIMEFKLDESAEAAIQQIIDTEYAASFKNSNKEVLLLGIAFGRKERNVTDWKLQEF